MSRCDPCEYSQFCATWGFCEECDAPLYRAMVIAEAAMREAGVPSNSQRAVPYVQILHALRAATGRPSPGEPEPVADPQPVSAEFFTSLEKTTAHESDDLHHWYAAMDDQPTTEEETPS